MDREEQWSSLFWKQCFQYNQHLVLPLKATKNKSPHFGVVQGKLHEDFAYPGPHHPDME
jgi:hypothetical protein